MQSIYTKETETDETFASGDSSEMSGRRFTPLEFDENLGSRTRIGVPGHTSYNYSFVQLFRWRGSSLSLVLESSMFYFQIGIMSILFGLFAAFYGPNTTMSLVFPSELGAGLDMICIFILVFFVSNVFSIRNDRFQNACMTNGNLTHISAVVVGAGFSNDVAYTILRYSNSIIHIYYMLLSGPLDEHKWNLIKRRRLLTSEEVEALQQQGAPAVVIYSWLVRLISQHESLCGSSSNNNNTSPHQSFMVMRSLEESFDKLRGLAAKQIAFSKTQIPFAYFHTLLLCINLYLCINSFVSAKTFGYAMNADCITFLKTWKDDLMIAPITNEGMCIPAAITTIVVQIVYIIIFCAVFQLGLSLCDFASDSLHSYDFGFDLDNLWKESQEALRSMDVPQPAIRTSFSSNNTSGTLSV